MVREMRRACSRNDEKLESPCALKGASTVRKGEVEKGPATVPRRPPTLLANQRDVLLIASYFSERWHSQIKACKSISRVYLSHAEQTLFIFSCGGS